MATAEKIITLDTKRMLSTMMYVFSWLCKNMKYYINININ